MQKNNFWLLKSEGACYSIDDLAKDKEVSWTGIRNYQARNFMRDMKVGDGVLFYHSSSTEKAKPNGIYGLAKVSSSLHPDETQFDSKDEHFDPKSKKENPMWHCVNIKFVKKFKEPLTLDQIKFDSKLEGMVVRQRGSRLSVQPVSEIHYNYIISLSE